MIDVHGEGCSFFRMQGWAKDHDRLDPTGIASSSHSAETGSTPGVAEFHDMSKFGNKLTTCRADVDTDFAITRCKFHGHACFAFF